MNDDDDDGGEARGETTGPARRMAEVALQEPLRVTRRELAALNRLREAPLPSGAWGEEDDAAAGGEWSDEDDGDGLAWDATGGEDAESDFASEDSNEEGAEGNDYPDEDDP
jgi:hypothetical protein